MTHYLTGPNISSSEHPRDASIKSCEYKARLALVETSFVVSLQSFHVSVAGSQVMRFIQEVERVSRHFKDKASRWQAGEFPLLPNSFCNKFWHILKFVKLTPNNFCLVKLVRGRHTVWDDHFWRKLDYSGRIVVCPRLDRIGGSCSL